MQVYVFYSAHRAKEAMPYRISPNTAGILAVSLVQTVLVLTIFCGASVVLQEPIPERALPVGLLCVLGLCAIFNYLTLISRGQWRDYVHEFHSQTVDDLCFANGGIVIFTLLWGAWVVFWATDASKRFGGA